MSLLLHGHLYLVDEIVEVGEDLRARHPSVGWASAPVTLR